MPNKKPEELFWDSRESLRYIRTLSQQKLVSRWTLLGVAIQRTLHTVPWDVHYESFRGPAPLNTLLGFVGPTGTGKTLGSGVLDRHMVFPDNDSTRPLSKSWTGFVEPGSGEAMPDYYVATAPAKPDGDEPLELAYDKKAWAHPNHAAAFSFDEVGMLDARNSRQGSTITQYLKQAYSGSEFGRVLKGRKGTLLQPLSYRFTCGVNLQPARAGSFFTDVEISGGFPSRFIWFSAQDESLKRNFETKELPLFHAAAVDWQGVTSIPALPKMDEAHKDQHFDSMEGKVEPIDSHLLLTRAKVACALAVLDNRAELNQEDWELSEVVIEHSRQTRSVILETLSKEGAKARDKTAKAAAVVAATTEQMKHEQNVKRVASNIKKAFKAGKVKVLTEKGLAKHISSRDRDSLLEAIQFLEDNPRWGEG
jgi:hypothetical protein